MSDKSKHKHHTGKKNSSSSSESKAQDFVRHSVRDDKGRFASSHVCEQSSVSTVLHQNVDNVQTCMSSVVSTSQELSVIDMSDSILQGFVSLPRVEKNSKAGQSSRPESTVNLSRAFPRGESAVPDPSSLEQVELVSDLEWGLFPLSSVRDSSPRDSAATHKSLKISGRKSLAKSQASNAQDFVTVSG